MNVVQTHFEWLLCYFSFAVGRPHFYYNRGFFFLCPFSHRLNLFGTTRLASGFRDTTKRPCPPHCGSGALLFRCSISGGIQAYDLQHLCRWCACTSGNKEEILSTPNPCRSLLVSFHYKTDILSSRFLLFPYSVIHSTPKAMIALRLASGFA